MGCELCGSTGVLSNSIIEGVILNVCDRCSKHGKVIAIPESFKDSKFKNSKRIFRGLSEIEHSLKRQYGNTIKNARTKLNLSQEELARKILIKESLLRGIENNKIEPSLALVKKLESFLSIRITEDINMDKPIKLEKKSGSFTIGDLVNGQKSND
ncbi:MAG TPA: multiprotein bridging factor aMBF1 [Candidatus Nanoarchaeia archaeon]|nr:multiprotein bridging factor aMBF1 [Candidatus Nanoarchaeia archaeon]